MTTLKKKLGEKIWHSHHGWGVIIGFAASVSGEPLYIVRYKDGDFFGHD